jgi:hypothetical protein
MSRSLDLRIIRFHQLANLDKEEMLHWTKVANPTNRRRAQRQFVTSKLSSTDGKNVTTIKRYLLAAELEAEASVEALDVSRKRTRSEMDNDHVDRVEVRG